MTDSPILKSNSSNDQESKQPEGVPKGRFFSTAIKLVTSARLHRHFQDQQTPEVDAKWTDSELAQAALYLACPPQYLLTIKSLDGNLVPYLKDKETFPIVPYLRGKESRISQLTEAAALICAEIDRLINLPEEDFLN